MTNFTVLSRDLGVVKDRAAETLGLNELTDAYNLRVFDDKLTRVGWNSSLRDGDGLWPAYVLPVRRGGNYLWLLMGVAGGARALFGNQIYRISPTGFPITPGGVWTGGDLNGIPIVNNFSEVPLYWSPPETGQNLQPLPNWPSFLRARSVRPFLAVLVAMGISESGLDKPYTVVTSHPADPGSVPVSWDPADTTRAVMTFDLANTKDHIVDGLALGNTFYIYKENTTWRMDLYAGGATRQLFRVSPTLFEFGALARNCVVPFQQGHFVVADDDILMHNGSSPQSLVDARLRRWFRANIDPKNYIRTFTVHHRGAKEIWVCPPLMGDEYPSVVLIWNYQQNVWTFKELPEKVAFIAYGPHHGDLTGQTWDTIEGTWDQQKGTWDGEQTDPRLQSIMLGSSNQDLMQFDSSEAGSEPSRAWLERTDFPFGTISEQGTIIPQLEWHKLYRYMIPRVKAPKGTKFLLTVGGRDTIHTDEPIKWRKPIEWIAGVSDDRIWVWLRTKYLAFRFECSENVPWSLHGIEFDLEVKGKR